VNERHRRFAARNNCAKGLAILGAVLGNGSRTILNFIRSIFVDHLQGGSRHIYAVEHPVEQHQ
jgi:hypothetical protein